MVEFSALLLLVNMGTSYMAQSVISKFYLSLYNLVAIVVLTT